jgi:hypothetical protein
MARKKNIAEELVASMREALAHAAGKPARARITKFRVVAADVKVACVKPAARKSSPNSPAR